MNDLLINFFDGYYNNYNENINHNNFLVIIFGRRRNIKYYKRHTDMDNAYLDYITHYNKLDFSECDDRGIKKSGCEFIDGAFENNFGLLYLYKLNDKYINDIFIKFCEYGIEISPINFDYYVKKDKIINLKI